MTRSRPSQRSHRPRATAGGTTVTLTGTGFTTGSKVLFGTNGGKTVTVVNTTTITVKTPSHAKGPLTVTVDTPGGTSAGLPYAYDPVPTLLRISPSSGNTGGGTTVTLGGTGFTAGATVAFGAAAGTAVTVVNSAKITVKSPPHAVGTVTVSVTTPGGTSGGEHFTY